MTLLMPLLPYALIAVAVIAVLRLRDDPAWAVAALVAAVVQVITLKRTQGLGSRLARALPMGRRSRNARAAELASIIAAVVGIGLLVWSFVR